MTAVSKILLGSADKVSVNRNKQIKIKEAISLLIPNI